MKTAGVLEALMDENMGGAELGQLRNGVVAVGVLPSKVGSRQVQPSR